MFSSPNKKQALAREGLSFHKLPYNATKQHPACRSLFHQFRRKKQTSPSKKQNETRRRGFFRCQRREKMRCLLNTKRKCHCFSYAKTSHDHCHTRDMPLKLEQAM